MRNKKWILESPLAKLKAEGLVTVIPKSAFDKINKEMIEVRRECQRKLIASEIAASKIYLD